jgi:hypothetical protein
MLVSKLQFKGEERGRVLCNLHGGGGGRRRGRCGVMNDVLTYRITEQGMCSSTYRTRRP